MYIFSSSPILPTSSASAASTGVKNSYAVQRQLNVLRLTYLVTTLFNSTGATIVSFYKRITAGSDTGRVLIGTLSIPNATAAGKCLYKDIQGYTCKEGEEIVADVTTAATTAGAGMASIVCEEDPESAVNNSNLVASA